MNNVPAFIQRIVAWLGSAWPEFGIWLSGVLIGGIMKQTRSRPHPWSTKTDYVSWASLTDRSFSARHLPPITMSDLPEVNAVANLFVRQESGQLLCPKSTTLFPAFAQYLTDGFLRTQLFNDKTKVNRLKTTSNHEIDLCPLYGRTEAQTVALRLMSSNIGEKGRLKSQWLTSEHSQQQEEFPPFLFDAAGTKRAEFEVLDDPLGLDHLDLPTKQGLFAVGGDRVNANLHVAMINTLFLREHNRLAGLIEKDHPDFDDDRVFHVARNVLIVMFIKIVVEEYINHIAPTMIAFKADPRVAWRAAWNKPNWMSIEFGLLYRWHSLVPDVTHWLGRRVPSSSFQFNTSMLIKTGLSQVLVEVSGQKAAQLGLGNTSPFLVEVESKGIRQGREARIDSYNAYRRAFSLPPAQTWSDVTRDEQRQKALAKVYGATPKTLEFYTGLFSEDRLSNSPLPRLITTMVAVDAFSQAMTNPLLSQSIWGTPKVADEAFTPTGLHAIAATNCLRDVLEHQVSKANMPEGYIGMTRPDWAFDQEPKDVDTVLVA
jgi:prostaglandin-endoperoxide synthase 2